MRRKIKIIFLVIVTISALLGCTQNSTNKDHENSDISIVIKDENDNVLSEPQRKTMFETFIEEQNEYSYYAYVDMNKDGVTELLMAQEDLYAGMNDKITMYGAEVFSIIDEEIVNVGFVGGNSFDAIKITKDGRIAYDWGGCGWSNYYWFELTSDFTIEQQVLSSYAEVKKTKYFYGKQGDATDSEITNEQWNYYYSEWENCEDILFSRIESKKTEVESNESEIEMKIEKIRKNYTDIQSHISEYTIEDGGDVQRYIDKNGLIRKIVAPANTYYSGDCEFDTSYNAEYYYDENENVSFVFLFKGDEEYRFYLTESESSTYYVIRIVDSNGSIHDFHEEDEINESFPLVGYCNKAYMEIVWAKE